MKWQILKICRSVWMHKAPWLNGRNARISAPVDVGNVQRWIRHGSKRRSSDSNLLPEEEEEDEKKNPNQKKKAQRISIIDRINKPWSGVRVWWYMFSDHHCLRKTKTMAKKKTLKKAIKREKNEKQEQRAVARERRRPQKARDDEVSIRDGNLRWYGQFFSITGHATRAKQLPDSYRKGEKASNWEVSEWIHSNLSSKMEGLSTEMQDLRLLCERRQQRRRRWRLRGFLWWEIWVKEGT